MRLIFYAPKFAPRVLLLKLFNLNSVEAEVDIRKLLFLGRFITQTDMVETVESLFLIRVQNYFDLRFFPWERSQAVSKLCASTIIFNILKIGSLILFSLPIPPGKKTC